MSVMIEMMILINNLRKSHVHGIKERKYSIQSSTLKEWCVQKVMGNDDGVVISEKKQPNYWKSLIRILVI